jgi:hypothetical protein
MYLIMIRPHITKKLTYLKMSDHMDVLNVIQILCLVILIGNGQS